MDLVAVVPGQPFAPPPANISWSALLAFPTPHIKTPVWDLARKPKRPKPTFEIVAPSYLTRKQKRVRYPRLRLNDHTPVEGDVLFSGAPFTPAEVKFLLDMAHVDVVGHFMKNPLFCLYPLERQLSGRMITLNLPYKRMKDGFRLAPTHVQLGWYEWMMDTLAEKLSSEFHELNGRRKAIVAWAKKKRTPTPRNILPLLIDEIDVRKHRLSMIIDGPEPKSPTVVKGPQLKFESLSSKRRIERLEEAEGASRSVPRLADTFVELPPAAPSDPEPSPTKSASPPSTPMRSPPRQSSPVALEANSSDSSRSFLSASEHLSPRGPTRVFRVPSETDSSIESSREVSTTQLDPVPPPVPSPVKRPGAPTPSRMTRPEPTTPQVSSPSPSITSTGPDSPSLSVTSTDGSPGLGVIREASPHPGATSPEAPIGADVATSEGSSPKSKIKKVKLGIPKYPYGEDEEDEDEPDQRVDLNDPDVVVSNAPSLRPVATFLPPTLREPEEADWKKPTTPFGGTASFDFSVVSNSSIPFVVMVDTDLNPGRINPTHRRRSEPLYRRPPVKMRARRRSDFPGHLTLQSDDTFREEIPMVSDLPLTQAPAAQADTNAVDESIPMANIQESTLIETSQHLSNDSTPVVESAADAHSNTNERANVNIDMRQNPDIFGDLRNLAQIADTGCAGQAKVVVTEEGGKLIVRFKLPTEHAWMFPDSQGFDQSQFSSPPSISSSPRIRFLVQQPAAPLNSDSILNGDPAMANEKSDAHSASALLTPTIPGQRNISDDAPSDQTPATPTPPVPTHRNESAVDSEGADSQSDSGSSISFPDMSVSYGTPTIGGFRIFGDGTSAAETSVRSAVQEQGESRGASGPNTPRWVAPATPNGSGDRTLNLAELGLDGFSGIEMTPTHNPMPATGEVAPAVDGEATPVQQATGSPTDEPSRLSPKPSFTPVNQATPQNEAAAAHEPAVSGGKTTPPGATAAIARVQDDDSPGREFLREFIRRSRPKRASTTETGSPIAPPAKRLPLGAKSPNAASPQKGKRKLKEGDEAASPVKEPSEPAPKRAKRSTKSSRQKSELEIDMNDQPPAAATETEASTQKIEHISNEQDSGPVTRRSSRLRNKETTCAVKSSIPTSIRLSRPASNRAGGVALNATVRKDQQNLASQTLMNTRRNKGNAEYPKQFLAKHTESQGNDLGADPMPSPTKGGKSVGWRTPLESVQEALPESPEPTEPTEPVPKTAAPEATAKATKFSSKSAPKAKGKAKSTLGKTGIAKPKATSAKRATKVAQNLGMVDNGTPVRPQRMTRARARSQS